MFLPDVISIAIQKETIYPGNSNEETNEVLVTEGWAGLKEKQGMVSHPDTSITETSLYLKGQRGK